jgi:hypothetical protein
MDATKDLDDARAALPGMFANMLTTLESVTLAVESGDAAAIAQAGRIARQTLAAADGWLDRAARAAGKQARPRPASLYGQGGVA